MAHQFLYAFIGMMMKASRYLTFLSLKRLSPGSNHPLARLPPILPLPLPPLPSLLTLLFSSESAASTNPLLIPDTAEICSSKNDNKLYANTFNH